MTRLDIMRRSLAEAEKLSVDSKEVFTEGWMGLERIRSWERARLTDLERKEQELLKTLAPKESEVTIFREPLPDGWDQSPKGCWDPHPLSREICELPPDGHKVHKRRHPNGVELECWPDGGKEGGV